MKHKNIFQHSISLFTLILLIILAIGSSEDKKQSTQSSSNQWFRGGTLHNATVSQWKNATYKNKLATAADWLASTVWKGHLNSPNDFDKVKIKSEMLVKAVDKVVAETKIESMKVTEIASSIITLSNDLGPK